MPITMSERILLPRPSSPEFPRFPRPTHQQIQHRREQQLRQHIVADLGNGGQVLRQEGDNAAVPRASPGRPGKVRRAIA